MIHSESPKSDRHLRFWLEFEKLDRHMQVTYKNSDQYWQ